MKIFFRYDHRNPVLFGSDGGHVKLFPGNAEIVGHLQEPIHIAALNHHHLFFAGNPHHRTGKARAKLANDGAIFGRVFSGNGPVVDLA